MKPTQGLTLLALATLACTAAHAQQSPYTLSIAQSLTRDSNVLRAPSGQAQADTISSTTLGLAVDQPIGRQKVKAEADIQANRFRNDGSLNNDSPTLKAEWDWQAGDHWEGEAGASHVKSLYRYNLSGASVVQDRNIQTDNRQFFRARLGVVTAWTVETGWERYRRNFSAAQYAADAMNLNALNLGMRYQPQPDLNARLNLRRSTGQYPNYSATLGADDFTRWDVETMLSVRLSAASLVDVRLAHTNEIHSQPTAADGPKWTGSLGWQWQPTGKLSFTTRWVRDSDTSGQTLGDGQINSQSKLTNHLELGGQWTATDKIRLGLSYQQNRRNLQQTVSGQVGQEGRDLARTVALQLNYQPIQALGLGCSVSREVRSVSGDAAAGLSYPYQANVYACFGRFDWR